MSEDQMDTDGGFDRASARKALKHQFLRTAKRYCRIILAEEKDGSYRDITKARGVMLAAYRDWRDSH